MPLGIERVQILAQPSPRAFDGYLFCRHRLIANPRNRPAGQVDVDWRRNRTAPEGGLGAAAAQQRLVDIVGQDREESCRD